MKKAEKIAAAAELFEAFTGHVPESVETVEVPNKEVALIIGHCDGVMYEAVRDGEVEKYTHEFKDDARPVLAVSFDGQQLYILAGEYQFTDRGIVDDPEI